MTALRIAAGAMLVASVGINFANIIGRYFLSVSLSWAEEAMLFLMIGCVFLAAGPVGWMGRHIRMDVVISLLPPRARAGLRGLFRPRHHRDLHRARDLRLAGHDHARRARSAQRFRQYPDGRCRRPRCRSGLLLMALLIAVRLYVRGVRHDDMIASRDPEPATTMPEHRALKCWRASSISSCRRSF